MIGPELFGGLVGAAACAGLVPLVRRAARRGRVLIDVPNLRSSHRSPKPRGGGLALLGGLAFGLAAALLAGSDLGSGARAVLIGALAFGLIGLWDDVRVLPIWPRLLAEIAIAVWVVAQTGPVGRLPLPAPASIPLGPFAFALTVVWLVGVPNFFNFMDGIDGLATGQAAAVVFGVLVAAWSGDSILLAAVALGATLGFLPYNWWPSSVFLGDVGSLPLGFLLAGLPLLARADRRPDAVLAIGIALSLFLLDPVETLLRRWRRGAPIGQSHREHRYQQLLAPEDPHGRVSGALVATGFFLSLLGAASFCWPSSGWFAVALALTIFLFEARLADAASRRSAAASPSA